MLRGLYTATAGMIALQRRHDTLTNNIANVNTPGYKQAETVQRSFPEMLISRMEAPSRAQMALGRSASSLVGPLAAGVLSEETIDNFAQGDIVETSNPFHLALWEENVPVDPDTGERPHAFFAVQTENGVRYTRNGEFTLNENNVLVSAEGFPVLDAAGNPIVIPDANQFRVNLDGTIVAYEPGGDAVELAQLGVVSVQDTDRLVRRGNGLYEWTGEVPLPQAAGVDVYQGFTERSNVNPQQAVVDLMQVVRLYEANQRVIQAFDRSLDKAVNEVGRLV